MGGPGAASTSADGELTARDGLYVADGAALPNLPAKHPTLTIMANADRIGRAVAEAVLSGRTVRSAEVPTRRSGHAAA